jgi:hypothetical protein
LGAAVDTAIAEFVSAVKRDEIEGLTSFSTEARGFLLEAKKIADQYSLATDELPERRRDSRRSH